MAGTIDELLAAIRELSDQIDRAGEGPQRADLEERHEQLRTEARLLADSSRLGSNLAAELAAVERQLTAIEGETIKPAWQEQFRFINDPSAYRRRINESIEANDAAKREELMQRRVELLAALEAQAQDR